MILKIWKREKLKPRWRAITWAKFGNLSCVWGKEVRQILATVESVFLYGSETWTLTNSTEKQIDGAYTRMLRTALNVSWRGHMVYIVVSYIVLSIVYARQTKDKPSQKSNVNVMNLLQNSQFSWNINFFSRSIYILLVLLPWRTQNFTIIDQEKHSI